MTTESILIVEDESKMAHVLKDYLEASGYDATCMERGDTVIPFVRIHAPALILLDIMLPGMDGLSVCREIRSFSTVPIIMITARVEEIDRIMGLELGADDYICKPFSPREVVARVKAVLRRTAPEVSGNVIRLGPIQLHEESWRVTIDDDEISLTPSEYNLFKVLLRNPGRVFSRSDLINRVQGYDYEGYERTIDSHIKNLRKKLAARLPDREVIHSVYGVGYKMEWVG